MKGKDKIREVKHDGQSEQFYKNKHGRKQVDNKAEEDDQEIK